ncbi:serine hydrolase domain-containing protein [Glacieibacterium sp.]|uniref:serine hydrolase domain-containing protein n=1 Tax=Glacieibacterium sp. TaxID=2860237 RepID=UPI003B0012FE
MKRLVALIALLPAMATAAPFTQAETAKVDALAARILATTGVPSASVTVVRDGQIAYAHAYGVQRADPRAPASIDARYQIASVSKQFTAAAMLLLAQDGKLSLDDKVGKYLPDLTDADKISLRQLLSHTSGYRDYWPQDYSFVDMATPVQPQQILDRWAKAPLDFAPGTKWQYSNTGYVAAGLIIEKVSGQPLLTFLQNRILMPLGMRAIDGDLATGAGDAVGFMRYAAGPVRRVTPSVKGWLFAAGELAMSTPDLAKWDISVIDKSVMRPASYAEQQREVKLADGSGTDYGLGVDVDKVGSHRRIHHGGEATGFLTENRIYPDDRAAVVVAVNADFGDAHSAIADGIEAMLFADTDATARARAVLDQIRAGKLDRSRFTANGNYYFTATAIGDYRASLVKLAEPLSFTLDKSSIRGGFTAEYYTITYPTAKLKLVLRAEPDGGKIEQFMLFPTS